MMQVSFARAGIVGHRQAGSHLNHGLLPVSLTRPTRSASATSFNRQRFNFESGREATMRTVSRFFAWRFSSCA